VAELKSQERVPQVTPKLTSKEIATTITNMVTYAFGCFGLAAVLASFQVKYFNSATNLCIIRCARDSHQLLLEAMRDQLGFVPNSTLTHSLQFNILHVAGSLRSCVKWAGVHNLAIVRQLNDTQVGKEMAD